jgi:RNA polymerase sigma-70 factor, ECF subfamily
MDGGETVVDDFDKLIDTYSRDIFRFVRAHTRDEAEAEDLTQEVFVRAYRHRETVFRADNIKAWLFRVAVNLCRDHARQIRRRPLVYLREVPDVAASPGVEKMAEERENARALMQMVLRLPVKLKEIVLLYYVEDCSIEEIASMLAIPLSTVKTRLHRARNQLRRIGGAIDDEATRMD